MDKSNRPADVIVYAKDDRFRHALRPRLERIPGIEVTERASLSCILAATGPGTIVVASTVDLGPQDCRSLTELGMHVVMLAGIVSDAAREAYRENGAASYLAMDIRSDGLETEVRRLTGVSSTLPHGSGHRSNARELRPITRRAE